MGNELPESIKEQKDIVEMKLQEVHEAKENYKRMKENEDEHPKESQDSFENLCNKLKSVIEVRKYGKDNEKLNE